VIVLNCVSEKEPRGEGASTLGPTIIYPISMEGVSMEGIVVIVELRRDRCEHALSYMVGGRRLGRRAPASIVFMARPVPILNNIMLRPTHYHGRRGFDRFHGARVQCGVRGVRLMVMYEINTIIVPVIKINHVCLFVCLFVCYVRPS
jgi:hypothetical protein